MSLNGSIGVPATPPITTFDDAGVVRSVLPLVVDEAGGDAPLEGRTMAAGAVLRVERRGRAGLLEAERRLDAGERGETQQGHGCAAPDRDRHSAEVSRNAAADQ